MNISARLKVIAGMIPEESHVVDVGCDHGLLAIYLASKKKCICMATDVNEKALANAKANINKYKVSNVDTYVTDGLTNINITKDTYIVIAGMGTSTIEHILQTGMLSDNLVLASNNQLEELRRFVIKLGYYITAEQFVVDHHKKYVIIKFKKGKKKYTALEFRYGPYLINNKEYLESELQKIHSLDESISHSGFKVRYHHQKEIGKLQKLITKVKGK